MGCSKRQTAPIKQVESTYMLTDNINNTVEIQRSEILLDGNGFTITKPSVDTQTLMSPIGWLPGIYVEGMHNVTVTNVTFDSCVSGITIENSSGIVVSQNIIQNSLSGIVVLSSIK